MPRSSTCTPETPSRVYERYRREGMAFKRIFPESHFSIYDFVRLTISNIARDLQEAGRQGAAWRHRRFDVYGSGRCNSGGRIRVIGIRAQ